MRADIGELLLLLCETGRFLECEQRRSFFSRNHIPVRQLSYQFEKRYQRNEIKSISDLSGFFWDSANYHIKLDLIWKSISHVQNQHNLLHHAEPVLNPFSQF